MQELVTCPHCGTPTSPSSDLCHRCGRKIPDYLRGVTLKCPNCLKITSAVEETCHHCGKPIPDYLLVMNREEIAKAAENKARSEAATAPPPEKPQPAPEITVTAPTKPSTPQQRVAPTSAPARYHYESSYKVARNVAKILSGIGWGLVAVGVIVTVAVIAAQLEARGLALLALIFALGFPAGTVVTGLLMVAAGQITRASVDNADFSGEMLAIMKTTIAARGRQP